VVGLDVVGLDVVAGSAGASAGGFFLRGLATVSEESVPGPCCAWATRNEIAPSAMTTAAAKPTLMYFMQSPPDGMRAATRTPF